MQQINKKLNRNRKLKATRENLTRPPHMPKITHAIFNAAIKRHTFKCGTCKLKIMFLL